MKEMKQPPKKYDLGCICFFVGWIILFVVSLIVFYNLFSDDWNIISGAIGTIGLIILSGLTSLSVGLLMDSIYNKISKSSKSKKYYYNYTSTQENDCTYNTVNYSSPIEYEEYVANKMREKGYRQVHTTPTTGDFGADILMVSKSGAKICIQCKLYSNPIGIKAVQEIYSAKGYYKCDEAWVCGLNGFTKSAKELAKRLGVKLYTIK